MSYAVQRKTSDKYLDSFKEILKRNSMHFLSLEVSDEQKDTQEATDMIIKIEGGDVALRVRDASKPYRDLTIRSKSKYGGRTEIDKIRDGFGDWYLYGWGNGGYVKEYILVDLDKVREFGLLEGRREIPNYDGATRFINIEIGELQMCGCIIAKSLSDPTQKQVDEYTKSKIKLLNS